MRHSIKSRVILLAPGFRSNLVESHNLQYAATATAILIFILWLGAFVGAIFQVAAFRQIKLFPGVQLTVPPMSGDQYLSLYNTTNSTNNDAMRRILVEELGVGTQARPGYEVLYNAEWGKAVYNDSGNIRSVPAKLRFNANNPIADYYLLDLVVLQNLTKKEVSTIQKRVMTPYIRTQKNNDMIAQPSLYFADIKEQQIKNKGFLVFIYLILSCYAILLLLVAVPTFGLPWYSLENRAGSQRNALCDFIVLYLVALPIYMTYPVLTTGFFVKRNKLNAREVEIINTSALSRDYGIVASRMPSSPWMMNLSLITASFLAVTVLITGVVFYLLGALQETDPLGFYDIRAQPLAPVTQTQPPETIGLAESSTDGIQRRHSVDGKSVSKQNSD